MNTKNLHRLIADEKIKLTDSELFGSPAYRSYLQNIADNLSGKYGRGAYVSLTYDLAGTDAAYTDNFKIYINTANKLTNAFTARKHKNLVNIGIIGHECGHILFTDFGISNRFCRYLESGRFYPKKPTAKMLSSSAHKKYLNEYADTLAEGNKAKLRILAKLAMYISNIIEDGYVERMMKLRFPGTVAIGIQLKNLKQAEMAASVNDMVEQEYDEITIVTNLLLQYVISGTIENQEGISNEYTDFLTECIPLLDTALNEDSAKERMLAVHLLIIGCWKYIKPLLDKIEDAKKSTETPSETPSENPTENPSESSSETPSETAENNAAEEIVNKMENEMNKGSEQPANMNSTSLAGQLESDESENEEQERLEHLKTEVENILSEGSGTVTHDNDYVTETADHELENILNSTASARVFSAVEDSLLDELKSDLKDINFGDIHKNVDVIIHRQKTLVGSERELYDKAMIELKPISMMLQKSILNVLKQRQRGATERGLLMGSRLDHSSYYRSDGKIFTKRNRPNDEISLAVGVLVDMSGSMSGERIRIAQAMTLVVYDFCRALNIPVTIYGHDTSYGNSVDLYSFAEFDSADGNDKYRLMNIKDGGSNRDGCAVRYVAEKLCKRNEQTKLFIVVSDGQPADDGYYGTAAELDLQGIRREYVNRGITFLAAAIGDDKPAIKRCYGEGAFLDITDLKAFPTTIAKIIARYALE